MSSRNFKLLLLLSALILFVACNGGGGGGDDDSDDGDNNSSGGDVSAESDGGGLATRCGVIVENSVRNPVDSGRGVQVSLVSVLDSNAVIVTDGSSQFLVKLQGVGGTTGFHNTAAISLFNELAPEGLFYFSAGDCTGTVIGGQVGVVGQIVTASGKSFTEELIAHKYAGVVETTGTCGEDALSACYTSVSVSNEHHVYGPAEVCTTAPASVRYRPSDTDCGGNASVVMSGEFKGAFSVQLRYPDGTDRIIESCESANCTPLKVQNYINTESLKVACFGAPGNSVALNDVNHVSIKREADDHEPPRFCIPDPSVAIN